MRRSEPSVAVVIPVRGGDEDLEGCLAGLARQEEPADEVIVVDDASSPPLRVGADGGVTELLRSEVGLGPAAARNRGAARARSEVLLFLDADVVAEPDLVAGVRRVFAGSPEVAAAFGSYVPRRTGRGLVSDWKDLSIAGLHHRAPREARSFWSACGAIRREVFEALEGFDAERFPRPSIEDLELGLRLADAGHRIEVRPDLQAVHRKRWTLGSVLKSDVFDRAIPWSRLMHERGESGDRLHLRPGRKLAAVSLWLMLGALVLALQVPLALAAAAGFGLAAGVASTPEIRWYSRCGGSAFAVGATLLHGLFLLYASAVFGLTRLRPRGSRAPAG